MFDVIFYFFYRIYNGLPKDIDPETSASLALGACIGLFYNQNCKYNIIYFFQF
ncbi:Uncharacterised protein [Sphingobacterium spiritivorum]|uniref:Uncharacterized protein n=1 Tax=Sphingobacterium spiritivorum ATCC 33861 TaxID=525373 RepID=D7VHU5_SPHSI|nr:hypothetical protein HMPREF0766_10564 [Sphingobacterium spiritivorum ATCC 33861]SUI97481.1 Uncharacterised protein [Sphingobacterium spiritivorum]